MFLTQRHFVSNLLWTVTLPLSLFWAVTTFLRRRWYPASRRYRAPFSVICVGNLHSGGSGKTPVVLAIAEHFSARSPAIVSRGYGGKLSATGARVTEEAEAGLKYGDEPALLHSRKICPVYVDRNRTRCLTVLAEAKQTGLAILDDGFQHLAVAPTVSLVLINTENKWEDSYCLPHGELREPISAVKAASAVLLLESRDSRSNEAWFEILRQYFPKTPLFAFHRSVDGLWKDGHRLEEVPKEALVAFSGIAKPQGFLAMAEDLATIKAQRTYSDHHAYSESDLEALLALKQEAGAQGFITTEKDAVKLGAWFKARNEALYVMRIRCELPPEFWYFLESQLESSK